MTGHRPLPARGRTWDHERMAEADADAVLGRFWRELRADAEIAPLASLVPADRPLTIVDAIPLVPAAMPLLASSADQVRLLDAAVHAYARARGLRFAEE